MVDPDKNYLRLTPFAGIGSSRALDDATHAFNLYCQEAGGSAQSMGVAMAESARKSAEQSLRFFQDLANAKGPADALGMQLAFAASQMQLFMEQSAVLQCQLMRFFLPDTAAGNARAPRG